MSGTVTDNPAQHRFEMTVEGEVAAVYYRQEGDALVLVHTEVPQALSGQGVGSRLAQGVFDLMRATGRKAIVTCPFLVKWANRHPEVNDVVVG